MKIYNKIKNIVRGNPLPVQMEIIDEEVIKTQLTSAKEIDSVIKRTDVINYLISEFNFTSYLEIGVRDPSDNFSLIEIEKKYSVDPGVEFESNPVDFKMTSDDFFEKVAKGELLDSTVKFDLIFVDGLHLANQVKKDILNSVNYISENGFIVLHDCNPPTEWHAREDYSYKNGPAGYYWNGTTWKAFVQARNSANLNASCIDTDWGIGILSKQKFIGEPSVVENPFFEYETFDQNRENSLNLITFDEFKKQISMLRAS